MTFVPTRDADTSESGNDRRWIVAVGACLALAMAATGLRTSIVRLAPRTAAVFEAAGLPVNLAGLDIAGVSARIRLEGDRRMLIVTGDIVNSSEQTRSVAALRVSVRSADGAILYAWTTPAPRQRIAPGEKADFLARLASPPAAAADVEVEFGPTKDGAPEKIAARKQPTIRVASVIQGSRTESQ